MAIRNEDGDVEMYTLRDIFIDPYTNKWESPKRWLPLLLEFMSHESLKGCPYKFTVWSWHISDYIRWLKLPRGVSPYLRDPYEVTERYIWKYWSDREGFDYDGVGDYWYSEDCYMEFETKEEALAYWKKNIKVEGGFKPKLDTVEEFCHQFGWHLYERKY